MNKVILMGRLTRDPETRYSQGSEPVTVVKYTLAVNRRFKREGEQEADFINCVAFGKQGEFAERYFKKGQLVAVSGRLSISPWDDQNGVKRWYTDVIIEDQYFAESKASFENNRNNSGYDDMRYTQLNPGANPPQPDRPDTNSNSQPGDFAVSIDENVDDEDLPF